MNVGELMVSDVVTIGVNTTVDKAVKLMNRHEIGCLVVVKDGEIAGMLTERDLLRRVLEKNKDPKAVRISEIMSKPVVAVTPQIEVEDAVRLMFKKKIKKLPVVKNSELVGLVTLTDVARTASMDQKMLRIIEELKSSGWLPPKRMEKIIDVYVT